MNYNDVTMIVVGFSVISPLILLFTLFRILNDDFLSFSIALSTIPIMCFSLIKIIKWYEKKEQEDMYSQA